MIELFVSLLFFALWIVIGFLTIRSVTTRFYPGRYRADVFAATVVLAFTIGAYWPYSRDVAVPGASAQVAVAPAAPGADPANASVGKNVSKSCRSIAVTPGQMLVALDAVGVMRGANPDPLPDAATVESSATLFVSGWAGGEASKKPVLGVCLIVDGVVNTSASAIYGQTRPDVAAAFKTPDMADTGFSITLPLKKLKLGRHVIDLAIVSANRVTKFHGGRSFVIR